MKKNSVRWWIVLAAVLVLYHVVIFAVPFEHTTVFFLSWAFTLLAMVAQVYVIRTAFYKDEGIRSKFYGFPIAKIGVTYLLAQLVLGLGFMAAGQVVATWIPLVVYAVLLAGAMIGLVAADVARDEVEKQDAKLQAKISVMRTLQSKAAALPELADSEELSAQLTKFAEAVRFSDPVSSEALQDAEAALVSCVNELEQALMNKDTQAALSLIQKSTAALNERNRLCKLNK